MMKTRKLIGGLFLEIIIIILFSANLFFLVKNYFDKNKNENNFFACKDMGGITLLSPQGEEIYLSAFLKTEEEYVLFFKLTDCPACIYKGLYELKQLEQAGKLTIAVTIHEWIEEWKAWVKNCEIKNIYFLKWSDVKDIINFPYTPILIKMKKGIIKSYRYITS